VKTDLGISGFSSSQQDVLGIDHDELAPDQNAEADIPQDRLV
jgi:hypothetical protein